MAQYGGDERRVERAMSRERFSIDKESTFDFLYSERNSNEIGQKINVALSLLRLRTDGSGEEKKIRSALQAALNGMA